MARNVLKQTFAAIRAKIAVVAGGKDLAEETQTYIRCVAELRDVPIRTVSVGPERDQPVRLRDG